MGLQEGAFGHILRAERTAPPHPGDRGQAEQGGFMQQTAAGALGTNYSKGKIFCSFYTKGEEIFNAVSHIAGAAFGLIAWALTLFFAYPDPAAMAAVSVFGASIVILYTMSALYHFLPDGRAKGIFRIFDHCTIYLLIAGTYTPYCVIALGGTAVGFWVLLVEWLCAAVGIAMNAAAMNNKVVKGISMALYFTMGWLAIFVFPPLISAISPLSLWLLLGGGIAYTGGIVFFALGRKVKWFHSVWHIFDLAGTALQFASILLLLL